MHLPKLGHRLGQETLPLCDALRLRGWDAEVVFYTHARREAIFKHVVATADAYVHRIAAGSIRCHLPNHNVSSMRVNYFVVLVTSYSRYLASGREPEPPPLRVVLRSRFRRLANRPRVSNDALLSLSPEAPYLQMLRELATNGVAALPHPRVLLDLASPATLAKLQGCLHAAPDTQVTPYLSSEITPN
jgi:hypothetical protein